MPTHLLRITLLSAILLTTTSFAIGQLDKKTYLTGGLLQFNAHRTKVPVGSITDVGLISHAGYFFFNHLAAGLALDGSYTRQTLDDPSGDQKSITTAIAPGPFIRYYLIPGQHLVNLLVQGEALYRSSIERNIWHNSDEKYRDHYWIYRGFAGPEVFLNKSVGIEILAGYIYYTQGPDAYAKSGQFQFNVGFTAHLSKQK